MVSVLLIPFNYAKNKNAVLLTKTIIPCLSHFQTFQSLQEKQMTMVIWEYIALISFNEKGFRNSWFVDTYNPGCNTYMSSFHHCIIFHMNQACVWKSIANKQKQTNEAHT